MNSAYLRKTLKDAIQNSILPTTAKCYERDLKYFWIWARVAYGAKRAHYPVPLSWLISFVYEHIEGLGENRVARMRVFRKSITGNKITLRTVRRFIAAVSIEHTIRGVTNTCRHPTFHFLIKRLRRRRGFKKRTFLPITADILVQLLNVCGNDLRGERDRALLLVAFAGGGRRRSEIGRLRIEHLERTHNGYIARMPEHKTFGYTEAPLVFPIFDNAARQLDRWLVKSGVKEGLVFRSIDKHGNVKDCYDIQATHHIVKKLIEKAGLPPALYGTHSLRSGFITQTARDGIPLTEAMAVSGHKTIEAALSYYRIGRILDNPAAHLSAGLVSVRRIQSSKRLPKIPRTKDSELTAPARNTDKSQLLIPGDGRPLWHP
jgi:integrase